MGKKKEGFHGVEEVVGRRASLLLLFWFISFCLLGVLLTFYYYSYYSIESTLILISFSLKYTMFNVFEKDKFCKR